MLSVNHDERHAALEQEPDSAGARPFTRQLSEGHEEKPLAWVRDPHTIEVSTRAQGHVA
jgi:hypothetical protein